MTDAITIQNPRNRSGNTGHVLAKRSVTFAEIRTDAMVASGASAYKSMCEHCHGGPGVEQAEWARGMLPQPPHLSEEVQHWEPNEVFWLVKHGVRMSAMPSFGETHDDRALWEVTAFVVRLPGMAASTYGEFDRAESSHQ